MSTSLAATKGRRKVWLLAGGFAVIVAFVWLASWLYGCRTALKQRLELDRRGAKLEVRQDGPGWLTKIIDPRLTETVTSVAIANMYCDDETIQSLRCFQGLESLSLFNTRVTNDGMPHLTALSKLRALTIYRTPITGSGLVSLANMPHLDELHLSMDLKDEAIAFLSELPNLRTLSVFDAVGVTSEGWLVLANSRRLELLKLRNTSATSSDIQRIQKARPDLKIVF